MLRRLVATSLTNIHHHQSLSRSMSVVSFSKGVSQRIRATPPLWHLVDAKGQVVGRLATQLGAILRGKVRDFLSCWQRNARLHRLTFCFFLFPGIFLLLMFSIVASLPYIPYAAQAHVHSKRGLW